jgi:transmembrane sensor
MDYLKYSAEDFALDEKFQKWVLEPNEEVVDFWEQWIKANPGQHVHVTNAKKLIRAAGLSKDPKLNEAYLSVWKNLNDNAVKTKQTTTASRFGYAKVAASLLVLIASSFLLWSLFVKEQSIEYRTAFGEIREYILEDGSKVTLNSNSLLKVTGGWKDKTAREVFLEGEAFFEIVKTKDRKNFEVNTADQVNVQVLGTAFNVNTRHEQVEVYLQSGKVKINSLAGEAILKPGDFIVYQRGDQALIVKENVLVEDPDILNWRSSAYVFNDTPLSEIVQTLEDNYGYSVVMKDNSVGQKKITAKISRKDVNVLLKVLSETLDIRIEQQGNQLIFSAN